MMSERELAKTWISTFVIDVVCQRMDIPYGAHQLEACLWQLPGSLLRSSIHSSSRPYLEGESVPSEIGQ